MSGRGQLVNTAIRWGLADIVPCFQIQPNTVADLGHMTVFGLAKRKSDFLKSLQDFFPVS